MLPLPCQISLVVTRRKMAKQYKLVVIGTGTAAMVAAMRVRSAGWSVAVIDFRPFWRHLRPAWLRSQEDAR